MKYENDVFSNERLDNQGQETKFDESSESLNPPVPETPETPETPDPEPIPDQDPTQEIPDIQTAINILENQSVKNWDFTFEETKETENARRDTIRYAFSELAASDVIKKIGDALNEPSSNIDEIVENLSSEERFVAMNELIRLGADKNELFDGLDSMARAIFIFEGGFDDSDKISAINLPSVKGIIESKIFSKMVDVRNEITEEMNRCLREGKGLDEVSGILAKDYNQRHLRGGSKEGYVRDISQACVLTALDRLAKEGENVKDMLVDGDNTLIALALPYVERLPELAKGIIYTRLSNDDYYDKCLERGGLPRYEIISKEPRASED